MALEHSHNLGIPSDPYQWLQVAIAWNTIMLLCVVLTMVGVKRTPRSPLLTVEACGMGSVNRADRSSFGSCCIHIDPHSRRVMGSLGEHWVAVTLVSN